MDYLWKLIADTAMRLNIQVFATTHSRDCVESFATICEANQSDMVSIQRIEPQKHRSVRYTESEIRTAVERHIEMR